MTQLQDPAELVATELVTNAYRYATGHSTLRLSGVTRTRLRLSVRDANPHIPPPFDNRSGPPAPAPVDANGGRGLFLVCRHAEAWGGHLLGDPFSDGHGKLLWCEIGSPS